MGRKFGEGCDPFWGSWVPIEHNVARAEAYLRTKWHLDSFNHLPQYTNLTNRQDRQDRTDNGPIA